MRDSITLGGVTYGSGAADVVTGNVTLGESLTASALSVDTLSVEVTADEAPAGAYGDPVDYLRDGTLFGRFYLTSLTRTGKRRWTINAVSAVGLLDTVKHYGGIYDGQDAAVSGAEAVIADIIGGAFAYTVTGFTDVRLYGWLPIASRRENLQQVLFAIGGNITKDAQGDVVISPLADTISDTVEKSETFLGGKVTYPAPASAVRVTEHSYLRTGEEKEIFSGDVAALAVVMPKGISAVGGIIEFSGPYYDVAVVGGQVLELGDNYCVIGPTSRVTVVGKPYTHNTKVIEIAAEDPVGSDYIPEVKDCTLVSIANSTNVAQRVLAYYGGFKRVEQDIVVTGQRPGDRVQFWDPYGEKSGGYIKELNLKLGALLRGSAVFDTGYIPSGIGNNYKEVMAVTESGTVQLPQTNRVRLVLIGGGMGGGGGYPGEAGKLPTEDHSSSSVTKYRLKEVSGGGGAWPATVFDGSGTQTDQGWGYPTQWFKQVVPGFSPKIGYNVSMLAYIRQKYPSEPNPERLVIYPGIAYDAGYLYRYKSKDECYAMLAKTRRDGKNMVVYTTLTSESYTTEQESYWATYDELTDGGAGGAGGLGGASGRVYQMDVECTPGEEITVTIGTGGAGGAAATAETDPTPGDEGNATTVLFRETLLTSAEGQSASFVDSIHGVVYGGEGASGAPGGMGGQSMGYGSNAWDGGKAYPGESVGEYSGGEPTTTSGSGGGASMTADGGDGVPSSTSLSGGGGAGADASPPGIPTGYGVGGTGGSGGGGGGNAAGYNDRRYALPLADPGAGGAGSAGGVGAPGAVLIFYGDPVPEIPADALKDWYRQVMTDADGKTVTVSGGYRSKFSGWQIDDFIEEVLNG